MFWLFPQTHDDAIAHPTWTQLQEAILRMDGSQINEVEIRKEHTGSLIIGGGNDKRYIVVFIPEDNSEDAYSVTLVDESLQGSDVVLTVQTPSAYPARMAVGLSLVLQVAEHFYHTGELPKTVTWEP